MKYFILVNPVSGSKKGKKIFEKIVPIIKSNGSTVEFDFADHKGHPQQLIKELDLSLYDAILIVGGDGTMHEVINGMLSRLDGKRIPVCHQEIL